MSLWEENDFEGKIREILSEVTYSVAEHHFGRPFLSAYQLAIEFEKKYPETAKILNYPIGGKDTKRQVSLSQYIALQLSRNIKAGKISDIEGGFISNKNLNDISFKHKNQIIRSSLTDSQFDLSLFRLKE